MDTRDKISALRGILKQQKLDGFLQPVHDEYLNEYPPKATQRLRWLTGFSGSAGTMAVLAGKAAFFTDGRYTLQAANETDAAVFEQHNTAETMPEAWLAKACIAGARIGYDAKLYTKNMLTRMEKTLQEKDILLVPCENLVDAIWQDRPAMPSTPLLAHDVKYSGMEAAEKRSKLAAVLGHKNADALLITAPDSVCWLLNIRASDVEHTPLALGAAIVDREGHTELFIQQSRISEAMRAHLGGDVTIHDPAILRDVLASLGAEKKRVMCDMQLVSLWHLQALAGAQIIEATDPCQLMKAKKNAVEIAGIRAAHIRDGAAVTKFLCWLDAEMVKREVTEMETCDKLLSFRAAHPMFHDLSFPTISGSGPHGAIVHYRVSEASDRALKVGELFLLDSGAQYPDGTTDITRTIPIGAPTPEHKDRFTRVLKGHIAIAMTGFPKGTTGSQLDALARQYLWQAGLDYDHGTGHGVGCFLGVHEGPQRISKRGGDVPLEVGMVVSNEPGYYKAGEYGIRIENLVTVVEAVPGEVGKPYLSFDTLTCVPIDTRAVDAKMLTQSEKEWLNAYHAWVLAQLTDKLDANEQAWLAERCKPV